MTGGALSAGDRSVAESSGASGAHERVFPGGGEMDALVRALDWSTTPLGPAESWSPALRMMVRFLLANRFPLLLWWGPQYVSIYNDPYRPVLGAKHPWALGRPVSECWSEIWHILRPLIDTPFRGGPATWDEDLFLEIQRHGFVEETHFTIAYSPVPDDTAPGGIGGVLATVHEITEQVVGDRRVVALRDLGARVGDAKTAEEACTIAAQTLAAHAKDVPFVLLYLIDAERAHAHLAGAAGIGRGEDISPLMVDLRDPEGGGWPFAEALRSGTAQLVPHLDERFAARPPGPWSDPPDTAVVLPVPSNTAQEPAGLMVAGVSARLAFDAHYQDFLDLVRTQVAAAIANARAYEAERRRAEALAELDRAKTAFFSNVSHEFRTPLTLLLGPLEDALAAGTSGGGALPPARRESLTVAHRNALRLLRLVNTLLDFSRIEAGRVQASYAPTDLPALTADLASSFRAAVEMAGLRLAVDCPPLPAGVAVYVDRDMWEKIVLNLLSNALKFTFEGEIAVRLRAAPDGRAVALSVRDTGTGIPAAELPRLFERFHRVQGARARTHEGTGIGLALVQELVRLHGGAVGVESRVDAGTTFTVTVPTGAAHLPADRLGAARTLAPTALGAAPFVEEALRWLPEADGPADGGDAGPAALGPREAPPAAPRPGADGRAARVLLADDNADMRAYLTRLLAPRYRVEAVPDGEAALAAARAGPPDLVLADVMMPRLDGFGLLRALRADARTRAVPVLLLSARAGEEATVEGIAAGADDYLTKPFAARELLARVATHLELARVRAAAAERERAARAEAEAARAEAEAQAGVQVELNAALRELVDERDRLLGQAQRATERTRRLQEITGQLGTSLEADRVLAAVARAAADLLRAPVGAVFLLDPDDPGADFVLAAAHGIPESRLPDLRLPRRASLAGRAVDEGRTLVVDDARGTPGTALPALLTGETAGSEIATPITVGGAGLGVVKAFSPSARRFTPDDAELLAALAAAAAAALHNARLYEQERAAVRLRDDFLATAAHDLKNPLTAVKGLAQLVRRRLARAGVPLPARVEAQVTEGLAAIERQAARMVGILDELLDLSRLRLGQRLELERRPTDLVALARQLAAEQQAGATHHRLLVRTDSESLIGAWDGPRLERVLLNLLSNAVKYSPDGGEVGVELGAERRPASGAGGRGRRWAVLRVRDQGVGVPAADLPYLFERFRRGSNVAGAIRGTGIGLAAAKHVVEQHGGTIAIESEEGRGTTVTVRLPLTASPDPAPPAPPAA